MERLRNCPFCGESVAVCGTVAENDFMLSDDTAYNWASEHYQVVCDYTKGGCGASTSRRYKTPEEAIAAWNRRPSKANMIRDMVLRDGIKITVRPAYEHSETAIAIRVSAGCTNAERVLDLNHMDCTQMDPEAFVCEVLRLLARDILMSRYDDLVERAHEKKERP